MSASSRPVGRYAPQRRSPSRYLVPVRVQVGERRSQLWEVGQDGGRAIRARVLGVAGPHRRVCSSRHR
jgi:hypothetical protein